MSEAASTLYRAAWVLPVAAPPLNRGAVLVDDSGRIAAVGPESSIEPPGGSAVIELGDAILLPGLVNVHAHPELAMFRGALEDLRFRDWILRLVGGRRRTLGDADFRAAALWSCLEAMRAGITTIGATEASGAAAGAMATLGMRGISYLELFGPDPAEASASLDGYRQSLFTHRAFESELVQIGISPHAPYSVSDELYRGAADLARSESLPMAVHIAESEPERRLVRCGDGDFAPGLNSRGIATPPRARTPIALLESTGVLAERPLLIHCVDVDADDVRMIAESGSTVAHCPIANARLGHGLAPVPHLLEKGVVVGLGTDSVASNNRLDLLEEARTASLLQRVALRSYDVLPAAELLKLCTIDGARALGLQERIGTLEPGKDADMCAVSISGAHLRPVHDPVAALFHSARASDVILTMVRGRALYRAGDSLDDRCEEALATVEEAARRLREGS
ncbi:amidohydrolase [soil metagenome]